MTEAARTWVHQWAHLVDSGPDRGRWPWHWPADDGLVPGTVRAMSAGDLGRLDSLTGPDGSEFYPASAPFGTRSLPPERLAYARLTARLDPSHPRLLDGSLRVRAGLVAPWFGQEGGSLRCAVVDAAGVARSAGELIALGVLTDVEEPFPATPVPAVAAAATASAETLVAHGESLGLWHGIDFAVEGVPSAGVLAWEHYALVSAPGGLVVHHRLAGRTTAITNAAPAASLAPLLVGRAAVLAARAGRGPLTSAGRGTGTPHNALLGAVL